MLASMTGFAQSSITKDQTYFYLEIRSLNGKYFKSTLKLPEFFSCFEPQIEQMLRESIIRGTVTYSLRIRDNGKIFAYQVNTEAVKGYLQALHMILTEHPYENTKIDLSSILQMPGVCQPPIAESEIIESQWQTIEQLTKDALEKLWQMRNKEGQTIKRDLDIHCKKIMQAHERIKSRADGVIKDYAERLNHRVKKLLSKAQIELDSTELAREVAIFAERADINEELSRLECHVKQFCEIAENEDNVGRKLEFLAQEMLRETNTIGSKANDSQIAQLVVEIKGHIDRIKEQTMNIV